MQSAYKIYHSTETAISKLHNDIIQSFDHGGCTVLASLDLSAAFDTVDHNIFLARLKATYNNNNNIYLKSNIHKMFSRLLYNTHIK